MRQSKRFPVGSRVRVIDGVGLASNAVGVVVAPETNHRGISITPGSYAPFDRTRERTIVTAEGKRFDVFVGMLHDAK